MRAAVMLLVAMGRLLSEFKYHRTNRNLCEDDDVLEEKRHDIVPGEGNSIRLGLRKLECLRREYMGRWSLLPVSAWSEKVCLKLLFHEKYVKWR